MDPIRRALQENEDWYRDLLEHGWDLLCIHDLQGRLLSANPAPARVLGYTVEELLKIPMRDMIAPEFRTHFDAYLSQIQQVGEAQGLMAVVTRTGERRIWEYRNTVRTKGQAAPIVHGIAHDVTEQKRAEQALAQREADLNRAQAVAHIGSWRYDIRSHAVTFSGESYRILGLPLGSSLTPDALMEVIELDDRQRMRDSWSAALGAGRYDVENRIRVHGDIRWVHTQANIEFDHEGRPLSAVGTVQDITERRQATSALKASERRFRAVYERSPIGICLVDARTGKFQQVNPRFCEIAGRTEADLLRLDLQTITHPDDIPKSLETSRKLVARELQYFETEKKYLRPDGSVRWVYVAVTPMWAELGGPTWNMAMVQDITERKQAEEGLREAKEFSENLIQTANVIILGLGADGNINLFNRAAEEITGYTFSELKGKSWFETLVPRDRYPHVWEEFGKILAGTAGKTFENPILTRTGEERYIAWRNSNVKMNGRVVATISVGNDITERRRAQDALRQSEERFRLALDGSPVKVFNQDRDLRYTWLYSPQEGWIKQDCLGKTDDEIFAPDDAARMTAVKKRALESGRAAREAITFTLQGTTYHIDLTVYPLRDVAGEVVGVTCACIDVTELHETAQALRRAKEKLAEEKLYLEQAINSELGFGEIVGQSKALKAVMEQVAKVAASDATVLLLGETGTGKELVARAIHRLSKRQGNSFIKLNCAAIPSGLLESELFGHEKGAFTGAVSKKIGRLELADRGTLFLDEIGEIPLDLQPKLLRVLQDQEFERLGDTRTLKVDFRLIAATNRDLPQSVTEKHFRSDLYYRLSVFPVRLPPLRERREDVRLLVEHFVQRFASRMNKSITSIPKKAMDTLMRWDWPGNIRELENFVERSVILTYGSVLQAPLGELETTTQVATDDTLETAEREHILRALRESRGRIGGPFGAAARLGLKRTTLQSKLKRLGIEYQQDQD